MVIGTIYGALTFHRLVANQKPTPAPALAVQPSNGAAPMPTKVNIKRPIFIISCLVVLSWLAAGLDFYINNFSAAPTAEVPLTADNARIDVSRWQPIINDKKQFLTNLFLANNGKSPASRWGFQGYAVAGALLDKDLIDAFFIVLKTKAKAAPLTDAEFQVGQSDIFISVPNIPPFIQWDDITLQAYRDGKVPVFSFIVFMYSDVHTPTGKHIYGEKCVLTIQDVIHTCATHNRNFIAD